MIVNDRITDYIRSLESSQGSLLGFHRTGSGKGPGAHHTQGNRSPFKDPGGSPEGPARILEIGNRCGILFSSHVPCDAGKLPHHHHREV